MDSRNEFSNEKEKPVINVKKLEIENIESNYSHPLP